MGWIHALWGPISHLHHNHPALLPRSESPSREHTPYPRRAQEADRDARGALPPKRWQQKVQQGLECIMVAEEITDMRGSGCGIGLDDRVGA